MHDEQVIVQKGLLVVNVVDNGIIQQQYNKITNTGRGWRSQIKFGRKIYNL